MALLRSLVLLLLGALIGAAVFHLYYRGLEPSKRCGWDYPFDDHGRGLCLQGGPAAATPGYGRKARHEMDGLIANVAS